MDRYAVLVFHEQRISDEQPLAFTRNFGEVESEAALALRDGGSAAFLGRGQPLET